MNQLAERMGRGGGWAARLGVCWLALLAACTPPMPPVAVEPSALAGSGAGLGGEQWSSTSSKVALPVPPPRFSAVSPLTQQGMERPRTLAEMAPFRDDRTVRVSAEGMALKDFLHHVFGELLKVNYVLDESVIKEGFPVTLNLQEAVSEKRLYELTLEMLDKNKVQVMAKDGIYFLRKVSEGRPSVAVGIGNRAEDIPVAPGDVMQLVPIKFGFNEGIQRILREFTTAKFWVDPDQKVLFVIGSASDITRAQEMIRLMDVPAARGRNVGVLRLTYVTPEEFILIVTELLANEGVTAVSGGAKAMVGSEVALVPLPRMNGVVIFTTHPDFLRRVEGWASQVDVPEAGDERRYFLYFPEHSKAVELGESLEALLTLEASAGGGATATSPGGLPTPVSPVVTESKGKGSAKAKGRSETVMDRKGRGNKGKGSMGTAVTDLTMAVDETHNALMFYATPARYQALLPLIRQLDILPGQVVLETTLAEVTLTDELKDGVEWFLEKGGYVLKTLGNLGLAQGALSYSLTSSNGDAQVLLELLASKSRVNILSSPRLVVQDGKTASLNVGTEVPLITQQASTTDNPDTSLQTVQYRSTGVTLEVSPTIHARGVVSLMVSNEVSEAGENKLSGVDSPVILNRSIETEVLARDGQTVILGGLISNNDSDGSTQVPGLGDIPLLGHLFKAESSSVTRTELVIMITPRLVSGFAEMDEITDALGSGLKALDLSGKAKDNEKGKAPSRKAGESR